MIHYLKADATVPQAEGNIVIAHICNDIGAWGKGFVLALSKRWKYPEEQYKQWYKEGGNFALGEVQFVSVEEKIWVANLIGQHNIYRDENGDPPIRYEAVKRGLQIITDFAYEINAKVQMPRIGCGLAGGSWDRIEKLIRQTLLRKNIEVFVCDL